MIPATREPAKDRHGGSVHVAAAPLLMETTAARPTHIGELNERSLHRALKARYAVPGSVTEQVVDGFVADVLIGDRIVEIETSAFSGLQRKLSRLLERFRVTLVHPIARDRYIVKHSDGDSPAARRRSPRHDSLFHIFNPLTSIPALLEHPNLTLDIVMVAVEEIRFPARRRWRRWTTVDRRLVEVQETIRISSMADLFGRLDASLPATFTTRQLAAAMASSRRLGQQAAFCFRQGGVTEICGKKGNALVYRRIAPAQTAQA